MEDNLFIDQDTVRGEGWFGDVQAHCIYCVLYLKSNAAADLTGGTDLQPGGWGPLF